MADQVMNENFKDFHGESRTYLQKVERKSNIEHSKVGNMSDTFQNVESSNGETSGRDMSVR